VPSSRLMIDGSWTKPEMSPEMGSGSGKSRLKIGDAVTRMVTRARPWMRSFNNMVLEELVRSRINVVPGDGWCVVPEDSWCVVCPRINVCFIRWVVFLKPQGRTCHLYGLAIADYDSCGRQVHSTGHVEVTSIRKRSSC
jgi:hypothetical protein